MTPDCKLLADIFQKVEEVDGFDGSDQQRQLLSLLMPVTVTSSNRGSVQSTGRLQDEYIVGTLELGEGQSSKVINCSNLATRRIFAVKNILAKPVRLLSRNYHKFTHEIAIMERLVNHPNVIEIKKAFFDNNTISIVMDFAEQGSLDSYIPNRLKFNPTLNIELNNKQIIFQICKGMAYVHAQGIVHCDLKPENILVITDKPLIVKVADFGIAQVVGSSGFLTSSSGTRNYMAPERGNPTEANGGFDERADSWSVGAIIFRMLTGHSHLIPVPAGLRLNRSEIISRHRIDWDVFEQMKSLIVGLADDFTRRLLEDIPARRLSMADAINHEWLNGMDAVQQPMAMPLASGSNSALMNNVSNEKTKGNDAESLTGTCRTQLVEHNITPSKEGLHEHLLPPIKEEADAHGAGQGGRQVHRNSENEATSNVQNLCENADPPQSLHKDTSDRNVLANGHGLSPVGENPPHLNADVSILPESSQNAMQKKRVKASQKPPVVLAHSPANGENKHVIRRSARLQARNQTGQRIRYSPY